MSRVDALVVLVISIAATGCRVGQVTSPDAALPLGDGLPDRILIDGPLPERLLPRDRGPDEDREAPAAADARADADMDAHADDAADAVVRADARDASADQAPSLDADEDEGGGGPLGAASCDLASSVAVPGSALCPARQGCYPFPFESSLPTEARCGLAGLGSESVPCRSQLDCAANAVCARPGEPDSVCLLRCDPLAPTCPPGQSCRPYARYPGFGTCG